MATNGHHEQYAATGPTQETNADQPSNPLPTDEVGWYFVEQYYTTLSKSPNKLHLFYGKTSQFVAGAEAEVTNVAVSRQAIGERIKKLDFQDAKVRISNVDSQSSGDNILIQVIGEISNKGGEPRKFTQTFVLAKQPSGYFVLNDMLRYIVDDIPEEAEEQAGVAAPAADATAEVKDEAEAPVETPAEVPVEEKEPAALETAAVDEKLEEVIEAPSTIEPAAAEPIVVEPAEAAEPEAPAAEVQEEPAAEEKTEIQPEVEKVEEEVVAEEAQKPEEPKEPAPTPAAPTAAPTPAAPVASPAPAQPEKPREPPKPMTWASRIAAAAGPVKPVVPIPKVATPPAATPARAPAPAAAQPAASTPQPAEGTPAPAAPKDEWQTAETKRQSRVLPPAAAVPVDKDSAMAYIKYVTDKVKEEDLKAILTSFGELAYFDINRQKNCAFVEFKTQAGYAAAIAKSPITVNGESIHIEQRRPKANAYGGSNYNTSRTGTGGGRGGRAGYEPTRTGSQGGGRGGFTGGQGRGRGGASRGRGAAQTGAA